MKTLCLATLLLAASCQTQTRLSDDWNGLPILDRVEVEYRGSLRASSSGSLTLPEFAQQPADAEAAAAEGRPEWQVLIGVLQTSPAAVERLLGPEGAASPSASVVPLAQMQAEVAALIEAGDGSMLSEPKLLVLEGTRASMLVANQTAYIDHFDFKRSGTTLWADPTVGVFADGLMVDVIPQGLDAEENSSLDIRVSWAELERIEELHTKAPFGGAPLTLQVPLYLRQDISGRVHMAADQAVVLPMLLDDEDQRLLVLVRTELSGRQGGPPLETVEPADQAKPEGEL